MTSSPFRPGASVEEQLAYYKSQYEQLEQELHEFQASSKDLEAELEKDVEESEKRERRLKEQVENLRYEMEEWKAKSKQSRDESNRAQTELQKEITTMREANRSLNLRLRDIEVANDDYERQARNTTSSLEDLESKYNVAIERAVMLEEEVRHGETEREQLRIQTQRLRDEQSDLRIEFEITVEKLRHTEAALDRSHGKRLPLHINPARPRSPSEASAVTPPSPSVSTPPAAKSRTSSSEVPTPPSPPLSDNLTVTKPFPRVPSSTGRKSLLSDHLGTSRAWSSPSQNPVHLHRPSIAGQLSTKKMGPPRPRLSIAPSDNLPRSGSLYQIKGLIGRMQKIEERVQSVRSKLPPPTPRSGSTPRGSPRTGTAESPMPKSVTMRSARKRPSNISAISSNANEDITSRNDTSKRRLSFGMPPPHTSTIDRPSSRASNLGSSDHQQHQANPFIRPSSKPGTSGNRIYSSSASIPPRPSSSMGGVTSSTHLTPKVARHKRSAASVSEPSSISTPTGAGRRTTLDRSGIPTPGDRRRSQGVVNMRGFQRGQGVVRTNQTSRGEQRGGEMGPPRRTVEVGAREVGTELGETF